jgi:hypothetical protein
MSYEKNIKPEFITPDYTGASADEYVDKYTNRPEDAGSLSGLQGLLGRIGMIPGVGEPADLINAGIYAAKGDYGNAALYGSGLGMYGLGAAGLIKNKFGKILDLTDNEYAQILKKEFDDKMLDIFGFFGGDAASKQALKNAPENVLKGAKEVRDKAIKGLESSDEAFTEMNKVFTKKEIKDMKKRYIYDQNYDTHHKLKEQLKEEIFSKKGWDLDENLKRLNKFDRDFWKTK